MECKRCGHDTERPIFQPVIPPAPVLKPDDGEVPTYEPLYKRWPCEKCGRYHFADGSLYANPYAKTQ